MNSDCLWVVVAVTAYDGGHARARRAWMGPDTYTAATPGLRWCVAGWHRIALGVGLRTSPAKSATTIRRAANNAIIYYSS